MALEPRKRSGRSNPVTEINAFGNERVLVYGHMGLCSTSEELLASDGFRLILHHFIRRMSDRQAPVLDCIEEFRQSGPENPEGVPYDLSALVDFLEQLITTDLAQIPCEEPVCDAGKGRNAILWKDFIEELYGYWRKRERFLIYDRNADKGDADIEDYHPVFIRINEEFKNLVLSTYRHICAHIMGEWFRVYRQLPSGGHVCLLTEKVPWDNPGGSYSKLAEVPFVSLSLIYPPLIYYMKSNKRTGKFDPLPRNPMEGAAVNGRDWLCFPAKVGTLVLFIYFHKDYIAHVAGLSNLFELVPMSEIRGKRPDGVILFGVDPALMDNANVGFWEDPDRKLLVGAVAHKDETDYFGYFKKTTLTLHNLIMIARGRLPIHGAMAKIDLKSGKSAHVVIVGDSGAGKSESLEAFRVLADKYIRQLTVVFDDMGSLGMDADGNVTAHGTEIGAFVRLDDLRPDYAYNEIDRSVFMNPHLGNARLVVPITEYRHVVAGYPVDLFLYANNYDVTDEERPALEAMTDPDAVLEIFNNGARLAKGTTDELGLVHTYFANPFGPPRKRKEHEVLAEKYVKRLLERGKVVGQLRTQLGVSGHEATGPEEAAKALFAFITKNY